MGVRQLCLRRIGVRGQKSLKTAGVVVSASGVRQWTKLTHVGPVNKLMHWIHRHSVFTAASRTRKWTTTCQTCNNYMCFFLFSLNFCKLRHTFTAQKIISLAYRKKQGLNSTPPSAAEVTRCTAKPNISPAGCATSPCIQRHPYTTTVLLPTITPST